MSYERALAEYKKRVDIIAEFSNILLEDYKARIDNAPTSFMPEEIIVKIPKIKLNVAIVEDDLRQIDTLTMAAMQLDDDDKKNIANVRTGNWVLMNDDKVPEFGISNASENKITIDIERMNLAGLNTNPWGRFNPIGRYIYRPDKKGWIVPESVGQINPTIFHFRFLNPTAEEWEILRRNYQWVGERKDGFDEIPISREDAKMLSEVKAGYLPIRVGDRPPTWSLAYYQIKDVSGGGRVLNMEPTITYKGELTPKGVMDEYVAYIWDVRTATWTRYSRVPVTGQHDIRIELRHGIRLEFYLPPTESQPKAHKLVQPPPPPRPPPPPSRLPSRLSRPQPGSPLRRIPPPRRRE
jgi:hypothetical protein